MLPVAEYPHQEPYPGAEKLKDGWGCSVMGLGVANYGGMDGVFLTGDWCSGRVFGTGWDGKKWQLQELAQTALQFTSGNTDEDGTVLAVNCNCFYLDDKGAVGQPARRAVEDRAGGQGSGRRRGRQDQEVTRVLRSR